MMGCGHRNHSLIISMRESFLKGSHAMWLYQA